MKGTWKSQEQANRLTEEVHTQDENMDGDCYERLGAMLPRSCQARNVPFIRMSRWQCTMTCVESVVKAHEDTQRNSTER